MKIMCPKSGREVTDCPFELSLGKVRDANTVGVIQCRTCKLVTHEKDLSSLVDYAEGSMHSWAEGYGEDISPLSQDNARRVKALLLLKEASQIPIHEILDFGCGSGSMLRELSFDFKVYGLEPDKKARLAAGHVANQVFADLKEVIASGKKFDAISLFHVVEHFYNPDLELQGIAQILKKDGLLIIETPNSQDALITKYESSEFSNFTYWSHHPMLHSHISLELLVVRNGFRVLQNEGIQRYGLDNHLYWLSKKLPGGHKVMGAFISDQTNFEYGKDLVSNRVSDTLWMVAKLEDI
jgi:SAM-dependent methyltransferase